MNKPRKWWISGLLSLLNPGMGQIYNGQARKGIICLSITNIFIPLMILKAFILFINTISLYVLITALYVLITVIFASICYCTIVIFDAILVSNKYKHGYKLKKYNKLIVYIGIVLVIVIVSRLMPDLDLDAQTIKNNYVQAYKIPSGSMEPTLLVGDHILVDRHISARNPSRSNIIIFEYPEDKTKDFIKRVEAVEGDTVEIRNKELYVNNEHIVEKQVVHLEYDIIPRDMNPRDNYGPVTVPPNAFFVMGDNRDRAYDSRFWGFVDKSAIKGTVRQIYWSWDRKSPGVRWNRIGQFVL